jgi:hypothetical protein
VKISSQVVGKLGIAVYFYTQMTESLKTKNPLMQKGYLNIRFKVLSVL